MNEDSDQHEPEMLLDDADEFVWPRPLGEMGRQVNGSEYTGHFTGTGWVTTDCDEGSFLSDVSRKGAERSWRVRGRRKYLGIEDLFPADWLDAKVEYRITVTARRLRRPASNTTVRAAVGSE
jgi:hypothetical protein